jgi:hypothetical protein
MGLSKVHFKSNLHIFPYLESNDVIEFFSPETYLYFGVFKKKRNLLSCLNRDDCEFLIILFFYKFAYNFLTEKDSNFFSLQNLFRKISSF